MDAKNIPAAWFLRSFWALSSGFLLGDLGPLETASEAAEAAEVLGVGLFTLTLSLLEELIFLLLMSDFSVEAEAAAVRPDEDLEEVILWLRPAAMAFMASFFSVCEAGATGAGCLMDREAQTGFCINSNSLSLSRPRKSLFCGVDPGNRSRVIVSSGLSGNHTSRAQIETKLAKGSHNSLPSTLIPDLQKFSLK